MTMNFRTRISRQAYLAPKNRTRLSDKIKATVFEKAKKLGELPKALEVHQALHHPILETVSHYETIVRKLLQQDGLADSRPNDLFAHFLRQIVQNHGGDPNAPTFHEAIRGIEDPEHPDANLSRVGDFIFAKHKAPVTPEIELAFVRLIESFMLENGDVTPIGQELLNLSALQMLNFWAVETEFEDLIEAIKDEDSAFEALEYFCAHEVIPGRIEMGTIELTQIANVLGLEPSKVVGNFYTLDDRGDPFAPIKALLESGWEKPSRVEDLIAKIRVTRITLSNIPAIGET